MNNILTDEQLQKLAEKWKHILRLEAWDIKVTTCRQDEMAATVRVEGENIYTLDTRHSIIHVLDPADYGSTMFDYDMEQVLVHELLHCHFAPFEPKHDKSMKHMAWEQTIDLLASVLVNNSRGGDVTKKAETV